MLQPGLSVVAAGCLTVRSRLRLPAALLAASLAACAPRLASTSPPDLGSAASLVRMGDNVRGGGDLAGAAEFYHGAALKDPADPAPLVRLGDLRRAEGDDAQAEAAYRLALAAAPRDAGADGGLAATLLSQGRGADALALLEPLAQDSPDARTLQNLGVALDLAGRQQEAQAAYRRGLALAPTDADLHGNLGLSLAVSGDTEAALRSMQMAVALPAGRIWQQANLVLLLAMAGREDEAQARAAGMSPRALAALLDQGRRARNTATPTTRAMTLGVASEASQALRPEEVSLVAARPGTRATARRVQLKRQVIVLIPDPAPPSSPPPPADPPP